MISPDLRHETNFIQIFSHIEKLDWLRVGWIFVPDQRVKLTQYAAGPGRLVLAYIAVGGVLRSPHPIRCFFCDTRRPSDGIGHPDSINVCSPLGIEPRSYVLPKPTVYQQQNGTRPEHQTHRNLIEQYRSHWHNHAAMHNYSIGDYKPTTHVPVFGLDLQ